jgi:2',3'-cyclic-nucleotide 2'-phosphodiesterase (5'-nucleotidase family)
MRRYQDLDVVLGGGSGRVTRSARVGRVLYAEAGREARWLGRVDLVYDTVRGELLRAGADVLEIGPDLPVHRPLRAALGSSLGRVQRELDRSIGASARRVGARSATPGQSGTQELIGRVLAGALDAEVVLQSGAGLGGLPAGTVRYRDIIRAIPDWTHAARMAIPAVELREILRENMARVGEPDFLGIHGAQYAWCAEEEGGEVRDLVLGDGTRPHGRRRLAVVFHPELLSAAAPGREALRSIAHAPASRLETQAIDLRSLVAEYVAKHGLTDVRPGQGFTTTDPAGRAGGSASDDEG